MMVGISGSGKSTWAKQLEGEVFSSDAVRAELFGDESVQRNHKLVFDTLHKRIFDHIAKGETPAIYDATNLLSARRHDFVASVKAQFPDCKCVCFLVDTPTEDCLRYNALRARHVPEYAIERQVRQLQLPRYNEGWDIIYWASDLSHYSLLVP